MYHSPSKHSNWGLRLPEDYCSSRELARQHSALLRPAHQCSRYDPPISLLHTPQVNLALPPSPQGLGVAPYTRTRIPASFLCLSGCGFDVASSLNRFRAYFVRMACRLADGLVAHKLFRSIALATLFTLQLLSSRCVPASLTFHPEACAGSLL